MLAPANRSHRLTQPQRRPSLSVRLLSLGAIRALLAATVLARIVDPARVLARDLWRQRHQDRALISHDHCCGDTYLKISKCSTRQCWRSLPELRR